MTALEDFLVTIAATVTASVLAVIIVNRILRRATKNPARAAKTAKVLRRIGSIFTQSIFGVLGVGLVWTVYFMVVGLMDEARSEYAANAATLIVSVLTVFSIMIAFYEFMARGKETPKNPDSGTQKPEADEPPADK
ncbi:hypothetical protein LJC60_03645 [Ruminococcaceae bacterium OttesenSCG-928-D13]|nr:hypothetical protein [Ruminococcaceae bacterium OttesenSCG-928-D13]